MDLSQGKRTLWKGGKQISVQHEFDSGLHEALVCQMCTIFGQRESVARAVQIKKCDSCVAGVVSL